MEDNYWNIREKKKQRYQMASV